jgi:hypothetical protein
MAGQTDIFHQRSYQSNMDIIYNYYYVINSRITGGVRESSQIGRLKSDHRFSDVAKTHSGKQSGSIECVHFESLF